MVIENGDSNRAQPRSPRPASQLAALATRRVTNRQRRIWSRRVGSWDQHGSANLGAVTSAVISVAGVQPGADVLDLGEPGGILVAAHLFSGEMRRMVDEPERRHEIDAGLRDAYRDLAIAPLACSIKAALNLLGFEVGAPRLPYVELDERETEVVRAMLERHGLLQTASA